MTFRENFRFKFLKWVSDYFDVAIITATQKVLPSGVAIGKIYRFKNDKDPFRKIVHVTILDIKGKYLQYAFCDSKGNVRPDSPKWSNDIEAFNICYTEMEKV